MVLAKQHTMSPVLVHKDTFIGVIREKWCTEYSLDLRTGCYGIPNYRSLAIGNFIISRLTIVLRNYEQDGPIRKER